MFYIIPGRRLRDKSIRPKQTRVAFNLIFVHRESFVLVTFQQTVQGLVIMCTTLTSKNNLPMFPQDVLYHLRTKAERQEHPVETKTSSFQSYICTQRIFCFSDVSTNCTRFGDHVHNTNIKKQLANVSTRCSISSQDEG